LNVIFEYVDVSERKEIQSRIWKKITLGRKGIGGDGVPAELFQILKDDAVKVLYSIC